MRHLKVVKCEDKKCRKGTELHPDECYELDGKGEYEDNDSHAYVMR